MIECREYPRIPVDMQVFFSSTNKTDIREGTMFDLSARGCAVTSVSSVQPGSAVRILIRATDLGSPITIESAAVRWSRGRGVRSRIPRPLGDRSAPPAPIAASRHHAPDPPELTAELILGFSVVQCRA